MPSLSRLFRPKCIAIVGGGAWCKNVIRECRKIGFKGELWPVHPKLDIVEGLPGFPDIASLPAPPDATFIGVNRLATVDVVQALSDRGAGGAVCFASGFAEASAELDGASDLQAKLIAAAGEMPILGPNCYGLINALDGVALWPDQHGAVNVESGVAIITQSSNMAINITMQNRGLPLAYVVTAGNQAQVGFAEIGMALLDDPRVTALGLHIEGIGDIRSFEALAEHARALRKPIVALKVGKSEAARVATISHTASLAGSDAGGQALLRRLGVGLITSVPALLETLKICHVVGPLPSNRIGSMSCSGGEASLIADTAEGSDLIFPQLDNAQAEALREALGPKVALANPLDYHTYSWANYPAMTKAFSAFMKGDLALGILVIDYPRADRCDPVDWAPVLACVAEAGNANGKAMAILASLPENMPEATAIEAIKLGVVPLSGFAEAIEAIETAAFLGRERETAEPVLAPGSPTDAAIVAEAEAKQALAKYGMRIPLSDTAGSAEDTVRLAEKIGFPVVLKGVGLAHKTEAGAVQLNLNSSDQVCISAKQMPSEQFLVEEMVSGGLVELLIGVMRDPAHGFVLTLGAGGTLTEILQDTVNLLLPVSKTQVRAVLEDLKIAPLLAGYRGEPSVSYEAILQAVNSVQDFVLAHADQIEEVEINPLICTADDAIAADALIRMELND